MYEENQVKIRPCLPLKEIKLSWIKGMNLRKTSDSREILEEILVGFGLLLL